MSSSSEHGTKRLTSGSSPSSSSPYRAGMHPATTRWALPSRTLSRPAASSTASMLSSVADWMNEQVLTTTTSASSGDSDTPYPPACSRTPIWALSTSFLAHPIVMKETRLHAELCVLMESLPVVRVLQRLTVVLVFQERDDFLQRVARCRAHAQVVALDLHLHLEFLRFDVFVDLR